MANEKVLDMNFSRVYNALVAKAERKGHTREEVDELTSWLTGYTPDDIDDLEDQPITYGDFFRNAPRMNSRRYLITGRICGERIEEIEDPTMQDVRRLDKLVEELVRGKPINEILR